MKKLLFFILLGLSFIVNAVGTTFIKAVYIDGTGFFDPTNGPKATNTSAKLIEKPEDKGTWTNFVPTSTSTIYNTAILAFAPITDNSIDTNKMQEWLKWPNNDAITESGTLETNLRAFLEANPNNQVILSFGGGSEVGSWGSVHNPTDPEKFAQSIVSYIASTCTAGKGCLFNGIDLDLEGIYPFGGTSAQISMANINKFLTEIKKQAQIYGLTNFKIGIAPQPYYNPITKSSEFVLPSNPNVYYDKASLSKIDYVFVQDYNLD